MCDVLLVGGAAVDVDASEVGPDVPLAAELAVPDWAELDVVDSVSTAGESELPPVEGEPLEPQPARSSVIPTPAAVRAVLTDVRFIVVTPAHGRSLADRPVTE